MIQFTPRRCRQPCKLAPKRSGRQSRVRFDKRLILRHPGGDCQAQANMEHGFGPCRTSRLIPSYPRDSLGAARTSETWTARGRVFPIACRSRRRNVRCPNTRDCWSIAIWAAINRPPRNLSICIAGKCLDFVTACFGTARMPRMSPKNHSFEPCAAFALGTRIENCCRGFWPSPAIVVERCWPRARGAPRPRPWSTEFTTGRFRTAPRKLASSAFWLKRWSWP